MRSLLVLLPIVAIIVARGAEQQPAEDPVSGTDTSHGCYSSVGELQLNGENEFNSQGSCAEDCKMVGAYVAATQTDTCYCGNQYPPASTLVDDSQCYEPCPGYAADACGGDEAFSIINTGLRVSVADSTDDSSSSEVSTTTQTSITAVSSTVASAATTTGPSSVEASSTANSTTASGSTSASSSGSTSASTSPTVVTTSGAVSQILLNGHNIAFLVLATVFLV